MTIIVLAIFSLIALLFLAIPFQKSFRNSNQKTTLKQKATLALTLLLLPIIVLFLFYQFDNRLEKEITTIAEQSTSSNHAGGLEEMIIVLEVKLKDNPNDLKGWNLLARSYLYIKDYKKALIAMKKSYQLSPEDSGLKLEIQRVSTLIGASSQPIKKIMLGPNGQTVNVGAMVERLRNKLVSNPNNFNGWMMLGRSYSNLGSTNSAIDAYQKAASLRPNDQQVREILSSLLRKQPDKTKSNNPISSNNNSASYLADARLLMKKNNYNEAVVLLNSVLEKNPNDINTIILLADATSMANGGSVNKTAYDLVKKALKLNPKHPTALWLAGMAENSHKNYAEALIYWRSLDRILVVNSDDSIELQQLMKNAGVNLTLQSQLNGIKK